MSCYGCASSFGIFRTEHACPNCGFSFCRKCLGNKAEIPKLQNQTKAVCKRCYASLTNSNQKQKLKSNYPDVAALAIQRSIDELEDPSKPPITVYKQSKRVANLKRGLSVKDQEIVDRLEKLKEDSSDRRPPVVSDEEIANRLARLKGLEADAEANRSRPSVTPDDPDQLISQLSGELSLENKECAEIERRLSLLKEDTALLNRQANNQTNPAESGVDEALRVVGSDNEAAKTTADDELRGRLSALHQVDSKIKSDHRTSESDAIVDDHEVNTLLNRIMEEVNLDKKCGHETSSDDELMNDEDAVSVDEFQNDDESGWCVLCNKDARLRCLDCNKDVYCRACFQESHAEFGIMHHKTEDIPES